MEKNNVTAVPCIGDVNAAFDAWKKIYPGSRDTFYRFMTVPSDDRDRFVTSSPSVTNFTAQSLTITIYPAINE